MNGSEILKGLSVTNRAESWWNIQPHRIISLTNFNTQLFIQ
jgi:hypothetical protein